MSKIAHYGLHSYGGYYANIDSALTHSPYPKSDFWITEWNAWCKGCDDGIGGEYNYDFAGKCVGFLLELLKNGATAGIAWEGYDSYYEHHAPSLFSYWGMLGYEPKTRTYFPRKNFYAIQHVSKYVSPGSWRVSASEPGDSLAVLAFHDTVSGRVSIVGINKKHSPVAIEGRLANFRVINTYSNFSHQALGGHLVLLGLKEAQPIWEESPYKILDWSRKQKAVSGFAHFQYLNDSIQRELNCCIPVDYPIEVALGTVDFVSEDVYGGISPNNGTYKSEAAIHAYYKLLNCGFRPGLAAGTDYPCNDNEPPGTLLTYVQVKGELSYRKWIEGIKNGKTVVSRNFYCLD